MLVAGRPNVPPAIAAGAQVAFVCDGHGAIVEASDAMRGLLGLGLQSLRGKALDRLVDPEDRDEVRRAFADTRRAGGARFSVRLRTCDGTPSEVSLATCAIEVDGARRTLCLIVPPIDGRRCAEERAGRLADTQRTIATILELALGEIPLEELLRRTLDLILTIPWLSIERKGAILLADAGTGTLVMKVHRGLNPAVVTSCARVPLGTCLCGLAAVARKTVYAPDLDARHTTRYDGVVAHGHYCVPICAGDATLGVITAYLAPGHERADSEIEFLTAVANTLAGVLIRRRADAERHEAERASRAKSELLALVSHELLTPVAAVLLACERLERDRSSPVAPRHAEILGRMEGALVRLASTIRLLLEHARLDGEGASVRRAAVDLASVAGRVLAGVRPLAERKGLAVRLAVEPPLPVVWSDDRLLGLVLANLASNAVKFTQRGSVVIRAGYRDGAHWVAVEDTGPGIPEPERARLFEPFAPLEPLANKHAHGMGLGLSLARRLAVALGGRLELRPAGSAPGSTFVLTLPAPAEGGRDRPARVASRNGAATRETPSTG